MLAGSSYKMRFKSSELELLFARLIIDRRAVGKDLITAAKFGAVLDNEIELILRKVETSNYRFTDYRQMLLVKGSDKKPREICIPTVRDSLVLVALKEVLGDVLGKGCITPKPQRVVHEVHELLESFRYNYYIKFDIEQFYHSIRHEDLMRILRKRIHKKQLLCLIEAAVKTPSSPMGSPKGIARGRGLPEGLPISNMVANACLQRLDNLCKTDANMAYFRYVDDMLIFCDETYADRAKRVAKRELRKLDLRTNDKSKEGYIKDNPIPYLGYVFCNTEILVREESIRRIERKMEKSLKRLTRASDDNKEGIIFQIKLTITGCIWEEDEQSSRKVGWVIYFSQSTDASCFARLDSCVKRIIRRLGVQMTENLPSFRKTYYEARYRLRTTNHIPRYGYRTSMEEKRSILKKLGFLGDKMRDDEWVTRAFNSRMKTLCNKLEEDVGGVS